MKKIADPPGPVERASQIAALVADLDTQLHAEDEDLDARMASLEATIAALESTAGDDPAAAAAVLAELLGSGLVEEMRAREEIVGLLQVDDDDDEDEDDAEDDGSRIGAMVDREYLRALDLGAARRAAERRGASPAVLALYEEATERQWGRMERLAEHEREVARLVALRRRYQGHWRSRLQVFLRAPRRRLSAARERRARRTATTGTAASRGDPPEEPEPPPDRGASDHGGDHA